MVKFNVTILGVNNGVIAKLKRDLDLDFIELNTWQNSLKIPELKFKRLFQIRWTSIRDSIKPIMLNITASKFC